MKISILTLFPEMFDGVFSTSILGKSLSSSIWSLEMVNIRDFSGSKHNEVDDKTYGGGRGRIIKADVLSRALESVIDRNSKYRIIYTSPRGDHLTQGTVRALTQVEHLIFICGRYEGIDQRLIDAYEIQEISIGDFVLTGGEIPVMAIVDSVVRLLPGTIKNDEFDAEESFNNDLLEYDQFTTPECIKINGQVKNIPVVLKSGDHAKISKYRYENAKSITRQRRRDIWARFIKNKFKYQ